MDHGNKVFQRALAAFESLVVSISTPRLSTYLASRSALIGIIQNYGTNDNMEMTNVEPTLFHREDVRDKNLLLCVRRAIFDTR